MDEVWKEIPNTDYSVSDQGRVASRKFGKWRVMCPGRSSQGYLSVSFCDGHGGKKNVSVHALVAEAFIGPKPTPKHEINHKNGIKDDNRDANFEWCTASENQRHRHDVLGHGNMPRGESNSQAKVTEAEVREIRRRRAAGETQRKVAADHGISQSTVNRIVNRRGWGWLA